MGMQFYTKYNVNILEIYGLKLCFFVFLAIFRHFHATHLHKNIQITKQLSAPALSWQYRWTCNFTGIITDSFFRNARSKVQFCVMVLCACYHYMHDIVQEGGSCNNSGWVFWCEWCGADVLAYMPCTATTQSWPGAMVRQSQSWSQSQSQSWSRSVSSVIQDIIAWTWCCGIRGWCQVGSIRKVTGREVHKEGK